MKNINGPFGLHYIIAVPVGSFIGPVYKLDNLCFWLYFGDGMSFIMLCKVFYFKGSHFLKIVFSI